jgi:hypothetical protein
MLFILKETKIDIFSDFYKAYLTEIEEFVKNNAALNHLIEE